MPALNSYATATPEAGDYFSGVTDPAATWAVANFEFEAVRRALLAVPVNAQTGTAYTLAIGDQAGLVTMDNAAANVLTIPANASVAFPVGTVINVAQLGDGVTTIEGDTGVSVNGVSAGAADLNAQYAQVSLINIAADAWLIAGAHGAVA